jgi:glycosyltransferase involved in cell wall biosynthesis
VDKKAPIAETIHRLPLPMRILLDCRPLQSAGPKAEKSRLIFSAAAALSGEGVEWLLVADRRYRPDLFPALPGRVVICRGLPGRLGWRFWYDRQIRRLGQRGVDMLWLTGGVSAPGIGVPICLWMPEQADPAERVGFRGYAALYRRRLKVSLERATAVICYSDRDRAWLTRCRPEAQERIYVLPAVPDETIGPLSAEEKEIIKAERTQGKEYFLADLTGCGEAAVVDLLKAFSLFKKRQQSHMWLVLTGIGAGTSERISMRLSERINERLKTYRYRQDVDWAAGSPDSGTVALTGAAYAVLLPVEGNSLGATLLNTWKAGVPVIAVDGGLFAEIAQGAVLGMASGDPASLAGQLMRIYKEEDLRKELIGKGFERLKVHSRENFLRVLRVITEIAAC